MKTAHSPSAAGAIDTLVASLTSGLISADATLRQRLITALNKLKQRNPAMELDTGLIELLLAAEIAGHYRSYQILGHLRPSDTGHCAYQGCAATDDEPGARAHLPSDGPHLT